jgi:hypothetical protein
MARRRFTPEQIVAILREVERGLPRQELLRKHGIGEHYIYNSERPHSSLGYLTPAEVAMGINTRRPGLALGLENNGVRSALASPEGSTLPSSPLPSHTSLYTPPPGIGLSPTTIITFQPILAALKIPETTSANAAQTLNAAPKTRKITHSHAYCRIWV